MRRETTNNIYVRASTRADMAPLTGDAFLCTVRMARYCARKDRPANAPQKKHSPYPLSTLFKTSETYTVFLVHTPSTFVHLDTRVVPVESLTVRTAVTPSAFTSKEAPAAASTAGAPNTGTSAS